MEDKDYIKEILPKLAEEMSYKWRVQSFSKFKPEATCVAYIDARDLMDRLDEVCDYGWERDHREIKGHIYAGVGIVMPSGRILWRWDCGTESNTEAEKGESSDSFKRAGVNWGVGRFLYDLKIQKVTASEKKTKDNYPHVVDSSSKRVWDLTKHINKGKGTYKSSEKKDDFLGDMEKAREMVGDEDYFKALNDFKYNKAEEVKDIDKDVVLEELRSIVRHNQDKDVWDDMKGDAGR